MKVYKIVRIIEKIEYVKSDNEIMAESPLKNNHVELVTDETVISRICEEVDIEEAKMYWINKNNK